MTRGRIGGPCEADVAALEAAITEAIIGDPERYLNGCEDCQADATEPCGRCVRCCMIAGEHEMFGGEKCTGADL